MKKLLITLATIVSFILFTGISGCEHKSPTAVTELQCVPGTVEFETILSSNGLLTLGAVYQAGNYVITNQQEYENLINSIVIECYHSDCSFLEVDFNEKIVIVTIREGNMVCFGREITEIETNCQEITVKIHDPYREPCDEFSQLKSGYAKHLVTIDKTDLPINFVYE